MKIVIFGAGIIGVTSAYALVKDGHDVTVVDKEPDVAMSCSFANGGQLSYAHSEPWASADFVYNLPRLVFGKDAVFKIRDYANPKFWNFAVNFLMNCNEKTAMKNSIKTFLMSLESKKALHSLIEEEKIKFHHNRAGILHFYRDKTQFKNSISQSKYHQEFGGEMQVLTKEELIQFQPLLAKNKHDLQGGILFPNDETGDAREFTKNLAKICKEKYGVKFIHNYKINKIHLRAKNVTHITSLDNRNISGDVFISCLGAYSSRMLRKIGIKTPIYPVKGYSISINVDNGEVINPCGMTDPYHKMVYSKIGNVFRAAGMAEFSGFRKNIRHDMMENLKRITRHNFGLDISNCEKWVGLRPFTPNSIPITEKSRVSNLYINSGHGSLGFTLSMASAKMISNLIQNR